MATNKKSPSQKAQERKISQVGDFKKRLGGIFDLPSGVTVKLRNPGGLRAFIDSGMIPNSLMPMVQKALDKGKKADAEEMAKAVENVDEIFSFMDHIAIKCIVEPEVHPLPDDGVERDEDLLYVDEVPDEDKMFIFQWVTGGVSDLETFRQQQQQNVAAMEQVTSTGPDAE